LLICLCKGVNIFSITPNNFRNILKIFFHRLKSEFDLFGYASGLIEDKRMIVRQRFAYILPGL
jgi:hypothetical protein